MEGNDCYRFSEVPFSPRIAVDIGANLGAMARLMRQYFPDADVYAFEPIRDCYDVCVINCRPFRKIRVFPWAITAEHLFADDFGTKPLRSKLKCCRATPGSGAGWIGSHRIARAGELAGDGPYVQGDSPERALTLDELLDFVSSESGQHEIDVLKSDCEGSEASFLGCASDSTLQRIKVITGEYHDLLRFQRIVDRRLSQTHVVHLNADPMDHRLGAFFALRKDIANRKAELPTGTGAPVAPQVDAAGCPQAVSEFLASLGSYPETFSGRGIVCCAGGTGYLTNAWVLIRSLRALGCKLPIEIWYRGEAEYDRRWHELVEQLDVSMVDAYEVRQRHSHPCLNGYELKPYALLHSRFRELLLLDADNVPIVNPEFLFETGEYRDTGAVFWPDYGRMEPARPIYQYLGVDWRDEPEFESGQMLIDKARCWRALNLTNWINERSPFFYRIVHGDKDTFRLAWHRTATPFSMPPFPIHSLPGTMCQHDFSGRVVFQHRNMAKWTLTNNARIAGFANEDECLACIDDLRSQWTPAERACGELADADRARMRQLARRKWTYHRVGHDSRRIGFADDGLITEGSAGRERFFFCRANQLFLLGDDGTVTCVLERVGPDWFGRWLAYEQMPIVLAECE